MRVLWQAGPPRPFRHRPLILQTGAERAWWKCERPRLLGLGAWEPATSSEFVSAAFLVGKKNPGEYRLVIDLRHVNSLRFLFDLL